jgi:hypothetical protein
MANTIRDAGREAFWRRTLAGYGKSGLTVREFCRREKLQESAFYFWRRTIRHRSLEQPVRTRRAPNRQDRKPPALVPPFSARCSTRMWRSSDGDRKTYFTPSIMHDTAIPFGLSRIGTTT